MKKNIAVLAGDGIGPEVMAGTLEILQAIAKKFDHQFNMNYGLIGGAAYEKYQQHFPDETLEICKKSDAILFGSVGGPLQEAHLPKWKNCEKNSILALRQNFQLSSNIRPIKIYSFLQDKSPLKTELLKNEIDIVIVRELVGDIYFGEHKQWEEKGLRYASDVAEYNEKQISDVAHQAFQIAGLRNKKLISVDKANVMDTSKLWRDIVSEISKDYPDIQLEHMLVDNCAMQLVLKPSSFDVIVTSNLFGDILSDLAAALPGGLGLTPSASINSLKFGLYEPSGGSAPDIAGKNIANPIAQILSAALMLRYSFDLNEEAQAIENSVKKALQKGYRTQDILTSGCQLVSTDEMCKIILELL